jgi:hypothetical protein
MEVSHTSKGQAAMKIAPSFHILLAKIIHLYEF